MGLLKSLEKEVKRAGRKVEDEVKRIDGDTVGAALVNPGLASGQAAIGGATKALVGALVPEIPDVNKIAPTELAKEAPSVDREAVLAAEAEKKMRQRRNGKASTILTGAQGLLKSANVGVRTLLG